MIDMKLNKYISILMDLYDNILVKPEEPALIEEKNSRKFSFLPIKKEIKIYPEREKIYRSIEELYKETIVPTGMSFNDLWEFCQFVKFAEKVLFYKNSPENGFYVDSNIDDMEKRQFVITDLYSRYQLLFKLEKTDDPLLHNVLKIIRLTVTREYGRKMTNEFTIVNSEVKYNDKADIYLIDMVNRILYKHISYTFKNIIKLVEDWNGYNDEQ